MFGRRTAALLTAAAAALAVAAAPASAQSPPGASVLVIGDSLEVGSGPYVKRELSGLDVTVDARGGRPTPEGVTVLRARLRPEHSVVVFDLGTNDNPSYPSILARDLQAARGLAGDRCMVVATINRPPVNGVTPAAQNEVIASFASETGAQVADWQGAVAQNPGLLVPDGVHATPEGYATRGALVADAVQACLGADLEVPPASVPDEPPPPRRPRRPRRKPPARKPASLLQLLSTAHGPMSYARGAVTTVGQATLRVRVAVVGPPPEPVLGSAP